MSTSNFFVKSPTRAFISIKDVDDADPPRARFAVITSPSRVTTVKLGLEPRMLSASRTVLTTTVEASNEANKSPISEERT